MKNTANEDHIMKSLTEAQLTGFRGFALPPSRRRSQTDREPTAADKLAAKRKTATRRAIEEYHEARALRREMEL